MEGRCAAKCHPAQLVKRSTSIQKVPGSNPGGGIFFSDPFFFGGGGGLCCTLGDSTRCLRLCPVVCRTLGGAVRVIQRFGFKSRITISFVLLNRGMKEAGFLLKNTSKTSRLPVFGRETALESSGFGGNFENVKMDTFLRPKQQKGGCV